MVIETTGSEEGRKMQANYYTDWLTYTDRPDLR